MKRHESDVAVDVIVTEDGALRWLYADGRTLPVVRGGDGSDGGDSGDGGDGGGGDAGDGGNGADDGGGGDGGGDDGLDPAAKAKINKANREAAALRKRLRDLETAEEQRADAERTELQRAQEANARTERQLAEANERVAAARLEAVLAGVVPNAAEIVGDLNVSRFLDDSGDLDSDAVEALRQRYADMAPADGKRSPKPNPAQGANGEPKPREGQLGREDLRKMSSAEIVAAQADGRLNDLLGIKK